MNAQPQDQYRQETPDVQPTRSQPEKQTTSFWEIVKFTLISLIIVIPIRLFFFQPFIVSGASMAPTFDDRQYLIVCEICHTVGTPERGDVVVFKSPPNERINFIKRIIGLPNETVVIARGNITIVNDQHPEGIVINEPYLTHTLDPQETSTTYLGEEEYFVMGDNRTNSSDSRKWGPLPRKNIVGQVSLRLLPFSTAQFIPGNFKDYFTD